MKIYSVWNTFIKKETGFLKVGPPDLVWDLQTLWPGTSLEFKSGTPETSPFFIEFFFFLNIAFFFLFAFFF